MFENKVMSFARNYCSLKNVWRYYSWKTYRVKRKRRKKLNNFAKFFYLPKNSSTCDKIKQISNMIYLRKIIYKFRTNKQSLSAMDRAELLTRNTPPHISTTTVIKKQNIEIVYFIPLFICLTHQPLR